MKQELVEKYIEAYNAFDVDGMVSDLHAEVHFQNIAAGAVNLELHGVQAFREQAEKAKALFIQREQRITSLKETAADEVTVAIDYTGVLAVDLPSGLRAGDKLELTGTSVFRFQDGKIISIQDIS
ncbi:nuclear transport factor 2 family protein [Rufibacter immobilis]|uniref:Nuclear transport factor 2 family protein n=1 Tax=Rufibacter immobilis TaxID=1348778 RepID=A0A3M9MVL7_9BACT|nr:nuclear transport factor 2 family protein [Rufibacter immobilis]RNI29582.1 nuclear transport factor 2 family protein [Rufibacter immobilis]